MESKLLLMTAFAALGSAVLAVAFSEEPLWTAGPIAFTLLFNQTLQVPLRAMRRGDLVAAVTLIDKGTAAVTYFAAVLLLSTPSQEALWMALSFGWLISACAAYGLAPPDVRPSLKALRPSRNPWKGARHYGTANLAVTAQSFDIPLMTSLAGPATAGIYGAVNRWTQPMGLLATAFTSAAMPYVARTTGTGEAWAHIRRASWLLATAILACLAVFIAAPVVVDVLLGDAYANSALVLRILAISTIFGIISQPLYVSLQALGYDKPVARVVLFAVVVQLSAVAGLSSAFGAVGAASAALVGQVLVLGGLLLVLRRGRSVDAYNSRQASDATEPIRRSMGEPR